MTLQAEDKSRTLEASKRIVGYVVTGGSKLLCKPGNKRLRSISNGLKCFYVAEVRLHVWRAEGR
jgi:hypothetical protein